MHDKKGRYSITDIQKGIKTPYTAVQTKCVICNT